MLWTHRPAMALLCHDMPTQAGEFEGPEYLLMTLFSIMSFCFATLILKLRCLCHRELVVDGHAEVLDLGLIFD